MAALCVGMFRLILDGRFGSHEAIIAFLKVIVRYHPNNGEGMLVCGTLTSIGSDNKPRVTVTPPFVQLDKGDQFGPYRCLTRTS